MDYTNLSREDLMKKLLELEKKDSGNNNPDVPVGEQLGSGVGLRNETLSTNNTCPPTLPTLPNSNHLESSSHSFVPREFQGIDPDIIIEHLKKGKDNGRNTRKQFYMSYSKWSTLKQDQKNNVLCWFLNLSEAVQNAILIASRDKVNEEEEKNKNDNQQYYEG